MSYRGMKWLKFNFIVEPKELEQIFNNLDYFIAVTNKRVEEDYEITDKDSIFKQYESYYKKVISGDKWDKKVDWSLEIHTSLTNNPNSIEYEPFQKEEDGVLKTFKKAIQLEPVINITNFCLVIDSKDRLSVAYGDPSGISNLGLQINYPKEIYNFENKELINTETLPTFYLYKELIESIKRIGKRAKVDRKNEIYKPNFWITEKVVKEINNNYNLKSNSINLI